MTAGASTRPTDPGGGGQGPGDTGEVSVALGSSTPAHDLLATAPSTAMATDEDIAPAAEGGAMPRPPTETTEGTAPQTSSETTTAATGTSNPTTPTAPQQPTTGPAVWSAEGAKGLREKLSGVKQPGTDTDHAPQMDNVPDQHDGPMAQYYACAVKPANIITDGHQRAMTDLEQHTTYLWSSGRLHLATVPRFFMETLTTDEYDIMADYHKTHLLYRLYIRLPRGYMLPQFDANRHFWNQMHKGAEASGNARAKAMVNDLFNDHYRTTCEPKFQMVTLTFIQPALRKKWRNSNLPFISNRVRVVLKASDTLSAPRPAIGFDAGARELQYSILILGAEQKSQQEVRAIARAASTTHPTLIEEPPPPGTHYAPHVWKLTYAQLSCPPDLVNVRRLQVQHGELKYTIYIHHHLSAFKFPCGLCLSVLHSTKDCTTTEPETAAQLHSRIIQVDCATEREVGPRQKIQNKKELLNSLSTMRALLAPHLGERLKKAAREARDSREAAEQRDSEDAQTLRAQRRATEQAARAEAEQQKERAKEAAAKRQELNERVKAAVEAMDAEKRAREDAKAKAAAALTLKARYKPQTSPTERPSERRAGQTTASAATPKADASEGAHSDRANGPTAAAPEDQHRTDELQTSDGSAGKEQVMAPSGTTRMTDPRATAALSNPDAGTAHTQDPTGQVDRTMPRAQGKSPRDLMPRHARRTPTSAPPTGRAKPAATAGPTRTILSRRGSAPMPFVPLSMAFASFASTETHGHSAATTKASTTDAQATTDGHVDMDQRTNLEDAEAAPSSRIDQVGTGEQTPTHLTQQENGTTASNQGTGPHQAAPPAKDTSSTYGHEATQENQNPASETAPVEPNQMQTNQEDEPMNEAPITQSPKKRGRPPAIRTNLQRPDGATAKSPRKAISSSPAAYARRQWVAPADSDDDDFLPAHQQPRFARRARRVDGSPAERQRVQAAVTEFFTVSADSPPEDQSEVRSTRTQDDSAANAESMLVDDDQDRTADERCWSEQEQAWSSQEDDELLAKPDMLADRIETLEDWLRLFQGRVVDNVGDGRCLYQAIDGALRPALKDATVGNGKHAMKEAHVLKQTGNTYLLHYLPQMVDDGTVHLRDLHTRYFGVTDDTLTGTEIYEEIVGHITETLEFPPGVSLPRAHWGGAEELFGLVWYLREPVFVIGADAHIQVYLVEQAEATSTYDERMVLLTPTNRDAWAMIQTMLNHEAIPRVLIHTRNHFRTYRFPEQIYQRWIRHPKINTNRDDMRDRLQIALLKLQLYAACPRAPLILATKDDPIQPLSQLSGSLYAPSSVDTDESQPDTEELDPADEWQLLEQLNPHQRLRSTERALWRSAEKANLSALRATHAPGYTTTDTANTVAVMISAVERRLRDDVQLLVRFLQFLPYPLVTLVRLPEALISRIGKELTMLGRNTVFQKWSTSLDGEAAAHMQALATQAGATTDARWKDAQNKGKWQLLTDTMGTAIQQHRTLPSTDEAQRLKLMVALVITAHSTIPVDVACAQAHSWITSSAMDARQLLVEIRCHKWSNVPIIGASLGAASSPTSAARADGEGHRHMPRDPSDDVTSGGPPRARTSDGDIRLHFPTQNHQHYKKTIFKRFREHATAVSKRRASARLPLTHRRQSFPVTFLARTQNVQGLPKDPQLASKWFKLFQEKEGPDTVAVTLIQETHADPRTAREHELTHRACWGFNQNMRTISHWSSAEDKRGGVAILLNPYKIDSSKPALEDHWTAHFIAITVVLQQQETLIVNVYAPTSQADRETLFRTLAAVQRHDGPIIVGGDFNCTNVPELDRSYGKTAAGHTSKALEEWAHAWSLSDALAASFPSDDASRDEISHFHATQHTYRYPVGDRLESCRLDRWYVSANLTTWVHGASAHDTGGQSDHASVTLRLLDPTHKVVTRRRKRLYPPKPCAMQAVEELTRTRLTELSQQYAELDQTHLTPHAYIQHWENFKRRLASDVRTTTAQVVARVNRSFRTKLTRLRQRIRSPGCTKEDIQGYEAQLRTTVLRWHALKRRRQLWRHTETGPEATRAFFERAALPRAATVITALDSTDGAPLRLPSDLANRMADGWRHVFTQPPPRHDAPITPVSPPGVALTSETADKLGLPITEAEVSRSIRRCKRTKSAGPDNIPNAWYRDYAAEIGPILHTLFDKCYQHGMVPPSFQEATIACIPKAGHTTQPLGYRPIALLNTDYKIYMRILATRLKPVLQDLISPSQAGFVPGRDIADTIDMFSGAQRRATDHDLPTIAVLLDIKKAYDTLDRSFLDSCLRARLFPEVFRSAVEATHTATTGRFRVNGVLSAPLSMTRGIRQGCPLAPILFIIAMDPLYRQLEADEELRNPLGDDDQPLPTCAGYADDTAVYARDANALALVVEHLAAFERVSGLAVNNAKSIAIRLNPTAADLTADCPFKRIDQHDRCRYLGIQVGRRVGPLDVWTLTVDQIRRRLAMAGIKTHTPRQRAILVRAIALPKILYIARHHWPTQPIVKQLQASVENFIWAGRFQERLTEGYRGHRWMKSTLASLPAGEGGLGLPILSLELQTMAAMVVARWCYDPRGPRHLSASMLCQHGTPVQPQLFLTHKQLAPTPGGDMWSTGRRALEWIYSITLDYPTQVLIQDGIRALQQRHDWIWWRGEYQREYGDFYRVGGREIMRLRHTAHGSLTPEWIPHLAITKTASNIVWIDGSLLTARHVTALGAGQTIADYVTWRWIGPYHLSFRPKAPFPLSNQAASAFRTLCDSLVANFPAILLRPDDQDRLRTFNIPTDADVDWKTTGDSGVQRFEAGVATLKGNATTQHQLQRQPAVRIGGKLVVPQFECLPSYTRLALPWRGQKAWKPTRRQYIRALNSHTRQQGRLARSAREDRWADKNTDVASDLASIKWHDYIKADGITAIDQQLWHRLRLYQLNAWPGRDGQNGCPRADCTHEDTVTTSHVVWDCTHAQSLWQRLAELWGAPYQLADIRHAIFSRTAPSSSRDWRSQLPGRESRIGDRLQYWLDRAWLLLVTSGCRRLWGSCVTSLRDAENSTSDSDYFATLQEWTTRLRSALVGVTHRATADSRIDTKIISLILKLPTAEQPPQKTFPQAPGYVLFFDGGSRGNPGPGGSGSVIVKAGTDPVIHWAAAMSYANATTTNNEAEYRGLVTGLAAAERNRWLPLAVVGDSRMIITQMQERRRPRAPNLRILYEQARATADAIQVQSWSHHYRAFNKMADKAANQAMDSRTSYQTTADHDRSELAALAEWLRNDYTHWTTTASPPHRAGTTLIQLNDTCMRTSDEPTRSIAGQ